MNEIVNRILLAENKFRLEMNLRRPGFTYSGWRPFSKTKERISLKKRTKTKERISLKKQET